MLSGASKPSRLMMVGPTLAKPGSFRSVRNFTPLGSPGPPIATGTCPNSTDAHCCANTNVEATCCTRQYRAFCGGWTLCFNTAWHAGQDG